MQVFLSFEPGSTKPLAEKLSEALLTRNVLPLSINLKMAFGPKQIKKRIGQVTGGCDRVLVLLDEAYCKSDWQIKELHAFLLAEHERQQEDWVLPVLLGGCKPPAFLDDRHVHFDAAEDKFQASFDLLLKELDRPRQAFAVMRFGDADVDQMFKVAEGVFADARYGYRLVRVDKIPDSGKIPDQILNLIARSDVVLADLSGARPNCYYETGYADALRREVIFTAERGTRVHFDLASRRYIQWAAGELDRFASRLREHLDHIEKSRFYHKATQTASDSVATSTGNATVSVRLPGTDRGDAAGGTTDPDRGREKKRVPHTKAGQPGNAAT